MADNVAITAGSGTSIAADDVGSVYYQRVKLSVGADGSASDNKTVDADSGAGTDYLAGFSLVFPASGGGVAAPGDGTNGMYVNVKASTTLAAAGDVASNASDSGNPVKIGLLARQTNPTAVTDAYRVNAMGDDIGRQVVVMNQVRDLVGRQTTTLSNTTTETTIVTAVASTYLDLTGLTMTNGGVTLTRVDIRDDTAGTVQFSVWLAPNGGGAVLNFPTPLTQTATNKNWTAQCSAATTDVRVLATFVKNV